MAIKLICPFCHTSFDDERGWQKHLEHAHYHETIASLLSALQKNRIAEVVHEGGEA